MATVTMDDGSTLELSADELVLYLQATGKVAPPPPPKSQAEIVAEKMIELRHQVPSPTPLPPLPVHDEHLQAELRESAQHELAHQEANETGQPVEIGNFVVMPGGRVLPKHVRPGGIPPRPKIHLPLTKNEMPVMHLLKDVYPQHLTTAQIADRLDLGFGKVSNILSSIFTSGRGLKKGIHRTWTLETWAYRAVWVQDGTPSRRWPPPEEGETSP